MYKFKVWLDSGANAFSQYEVEVTTDDLGLSDEEWDQLSEEEKEETMKEIAFERAEWGFSLIE
ncbi:TPA: hypothetical protein NV922_001318 [Escherichia coli]|nr:hypothetical protein [Escherichia coli]